MHLDELLRLNREGLIPGPGETEESFVARAAAARSQPGDSDLPPAHWDWAAVQLRTLFDFSPTWCRVAMSSQGLALWEGAATWIDVKRIYTIQISQRPWVRLLVDRDELLAHEAAHAARAAFDEPRFEEVFAYLTSAARWRRIAGPLFERPFEAALFAGLFAGGALLQAAEAVWSITLFSEGVFLAAACCFLALSLRCLRNRILLNRAAEQIKRWLKDPSQALSALFRLTDREIVGLARGRPLRPKEELRWRLLKAAYFRETVDDEVIDGTDDAD